jgi:hypothetical protein
VSKNGVSLLTLGIPFAQRFVSLTASSNAPSTTSRSLALYFSTKVLLQIASSTRLGVATPSFSSAVRTPSSTIGFSTPKYHEPCTRTFLKWEAASRAIHSNSSSPGLLSVVNWCSDGSSKFLIAHRLSSDPRYGHCPFLLVVVVGALSRRTDPLELTVVHQLVIGLGFY